jgi:hypothetical protein
MADDTGDGLTTGAAKKTFAAGVALLAAGDTLYVKAGSYSLSGALTATAGTLIAPVQIRGCDVAWNDLHAATWASTHTANGFIDTTNFPALACGGNLFTVGDFSLVSGLDISGSRNGALLAIGSVNRISRCKIANANTGASATAITSASARTSIVDCDLSTASTSAGFALNLGSSDVKACRITSTSGGGITSSSNITVSACVFYSVTQTAIVSNTANSLIVTIDANTFQSCGTCLSLPNQAQTAPLTIVRNNQVTNCTTFANNLRSGTQKIPIYGGYNRIRNTTTTYTGFSNIADNGTMPGDITTAQTDAAEYVASTATPPDLHLTSAAAGKGAGMVPYVDTGAYQRQEPAGSFPILTSTIVRGLP